MSCAKYITDVKGYIQALFEDAVGLPVVEMEKNWKEFLNTKSSDSVSKMELAYELAQPYKEEISFYGLLCYKLCCCLYRKDHQEKELYEEAVKYLRHPEILKDAQINQRFFLERFHAEYIEGIQEEALKRIKHVERLQPFMGDDQWNFHDGVIHEMRFDREKDRLTVVIDTYCRTWSDSGNETYLVPFIFTDCVNIEMDLDAGNDYIWTSRIYLLNDFLYVEFESAHLKVSSKQLAIGKITTQNV